MRRIVALLPALALALAGCGLREPLAPAPGQAMPPAPAMASRAMTTDELLEPPPIARPGRVDELLRRSEVREDDRFDMPPGDIPAGDNASGDAPE
jgi:predicted small lipoprotein YifL